jgi:hypothetical protein
MVYTPKEHSRKAAWKALDRRCRAAPVLPVITLRLRAFWDDLGHGRLADCHAFPKPGGKNFVAIP